MRGTRAGRTQPNGIGSSLPLCRGVTWKESEEETLDAADFSTPQICQYAQQLFAIADVNGDGAGVFLSCINITLGSGGGELR